MGWLADRGRPFAHTGAIAALLRLAACSSEPPIDEETGEPTGGTCEDASCEPDPCGGDPCCGDPCCGDPPCCGDQGPDEGCFDDTNDTVDPPPPGDACDPFGCGHGECVLDELGAPRCDCPEGYANIVDMCLPCDEVSDNYDILVPTLTVSVGVNLDGQETPESPDESARLWLVGLGGDEVALGDTTESQLYAEVIPGRYALVYGHIAGDVMPRNTAATVAWLNVSDDDHSFFVDLQAVAVTGGFTIDGVPAPASAAENGRVTLRAGADAVVLGETADGGYQTTVLAGTYTLEYAWLAGESVVPANPRVRIGIFDAHPAEQPLDIDIPTVNVDAEVLFDGELPPVSDAENARLSLVGALADDVIVLGETSDLSFARRVVPGAYEIVYEHLAGGTVVPTNARASLGGVDLVGSQQITVDIPVATPTGVFTLDGVVPPDAGSDATIYLSTPGGDWAQLGLLSAGNYEARVIAGEYDLVYAVTETDDVDVPRNAGAVVAQVIVEGEPVIDIDVPTVALTGAVTIDGAAPPVMGDGGALLLRDAGTGETFELAPAFAATFAVRVVPGTYEVIYAADEVAVVAPANASSVIAEIDVTDDAAIDLDVPSSAIMGVILVGGAIPGSDAVGELRLEDTANAESVFALADVADANYVGRVTPGSYVVRYIVPDGVGVPANTNAALACIAVP